MSSNTHSDGITLLVVQGSEPELLHLPRQLTQALIVKVLVARTAAGTVDFTRRFRPTIVLFGPSMVDHEGACLPDVVKSIYPGASVIVMDPEALKN